MVRNGEVGRIVQNNPDGSRVDLQFDWQGVLQTVDQVSAAGAAVLKYFDTQNSHPYKELDVSTDSTGKVTAAQLQLEQNIIAAGGSVGQIFGSALGRALAPNNQFAQLAVGRSPA